MPSYQYRCRDCAAVFEKSHGMSETPRYACPQCGGLTQRVIGKAPTVLGRSKAPDTEAEPPAVGEDTAHECGSGCAMHRYHPGKLP